VIQIETRPLHQWLPEKRWFGGKGRPIASIDVIDAGVVEDGPPALALTVVEVHYEWGVGELYHLPLLVDEGGLPRDALDEPDRLRVFGDLMAHGSSIKGDLGVFQFGGPGLDPLSPPGSSSARTMGAEQTNSSLVLDEHVIIKLFRRVAVGANPDLELARLLTSEDFEHVPPHVGAVMYEREGDDGHSLRIDLGLAQHFMPEAREGWTDVLRRLHELYDAIDPEDATEDIHFLIEERARKLLQNLDELGDVTASLHVTLAKEEHEHEYAPESVDEFDLREWVERALQSLDALLAEETTELEHLAPAVRDRIGRLTELEHAGQKTRVHGDYHLGQVLRTVRGWMILDFEGEPARPLDERAAKQSPLRDVAGMLRSFSYAAVAALFERCEIDSDEWKRLEPWAIMWEEIARERFLTAYLTRVHERRFLLPSDREPIDVMLDVFEIDKALYELGYERRHRPDWARIPLRGIARVIERGEST
jgi:trehalose synthase-fused probable maltokinase